MSNYSGLTIAEHLAVAKKSLAAAEYRQVHEHCMAALALSNSRGNASAEAYYLLAHIPAEHKNPRKALEVVERALALAPQEPVCLAFAAQQLLALNEQRLAYERASAALNSRPEDAHTLDTIGVVFSRTGDHATALPCFEAAVARSPDNASFQYNLASSSQFLGRFDQARRAYETAIALEPAHYRAHSALSQLATASDSDNHISQLQGVFDTVSGDADAALHIGHALAKEHEDLGNYADAFAWLERAKRGKREALGHRSQDDQALFDAALETVSAWSPDSRPDINGASGPGPIFVVGMPRTGTTLVDRMLSSHSGVLSVGELTQFALLVKRATGTQSPYVLDAPTLRSAAAKPLLDVGNRYQEYVAGLLPEDAAPGTRSVDKMPLNFFFVPLILKAIPNARVIALRRHPMDACLSNYRQLFATSFSYYRYAFDLEQTARYYAGYAGLMDAFSQQLPAQRFTVVGYEALVADFESEARRLIAFCGLDWEAQCLQFHENAAPVATASSVQVRQPLYQRASGRWRRYGDALEPLAKALEGYGVDIGR